MSSFRELTNFPHPTRSFKKKAFQTEQKTVSDICKGMKTTAITFAILAAATLTCFSRTIDAEHSVVTIHAYHGDGSMVEATMTGMQGTVEFNPEALDQSRFSVCIDPSTFNSEIGFRNFHIKSYQYLGARKYPEICFISKKIVASGENYLVTGDLTLHGVTLQVAIPFSYRNGILEGSLKINRYDYGIGNDNEERVSPEVDAMIKCVLR